MAMQLWAFFLFFYFFIKDYNSPTQLLDELCKTYNDLLSIYDLTKRQNIVYGMIQKTFFFSSPSMDSTENPIHMHESQELS